MIGRAVVADREGEEQITPATYGYDAEYAYLYICSTCFHLYERGRPDGMEQRCRCRPAETARWPRHDFNQRASLCRCCGLNALASGSRWSPYFCRECQLLAMGVSVWNRQLIFPVGRHSLMHTWVSAPPPVSPPDHRSDTETLVTGVHQVLSGIGRGSDGLLQWYTTIMSRNLQHFRIEGDVSLREYLEVVAAEAPALSTRLDAFTGLCELFQSTPPPDSRRN